MKAKTLTLAFLCFATLIGSTSAATVFRVSVEGQPDVLTSTPPVERGSVTLVRRLSDGQLTAIPSELVRAVSAVPKTGVIRSSNAGAGKLTTTLTRTKAATTLAAGKTTLAAGNATPTVAAGKMINGTTIVLGPTGGTRISSSDALVVSATRSATASAATLGIPLEAQIFRGDLPRLTPRGTELTLGSPATAATTANAAPALTEIGPNGFPVFANVTVPALATVGPNGFLTTTNVSGQQTGVLPIGPNGFPDTTASANTGVTVGGANIPVTTQATGSTGSAAGATTVGVAGAPAAGTSAAPAAGGAATASPQ